MVRKRDLEQSKRELPAAPEPLAVEELRDYDYNNENDASYCVNNAAVSRLFRSIQINTHARRHTRTHARMQAHTHVINAYKKKYKEFMNVCVRVSKFVQVAVVSLMSPFSIRNTYLGLLKINSFILDFKMVYFDYQNDIA